MAYWVEPKPAFTALDYDVVELYAGRARITNIAQKVGYRAIAADKNYDDNPTQSALELNGNAGFTLAVMMILSGSPAGAISMLGIECSTFVSMSRGSTKRDELNPWGNVSAPSVAAANKATSRQEKQQPQLFLACAPGYPKPTQTLI
ncbi:unnamed protein product [Symbiodinium natans]|uniref:Uncharacterized protein n=1 Tax=Symbiodinium natans TaxID=878477 RepID=A0A812RL89_9DINO|nr:unnamed protein product [Symbiodinium natans]CAE7239961.1 unnamed protein product [Symbiodinium natans]CAE7445130.1 unnamed protein product [Symbiodinium natans]